MGLDIAQERAELAERKRKEAALEEKIAKKREQRKHVEEIAKINRDIPIGQHSEEKRVSGKTFPVIDCGACKTPAAMSPTAVPRFGGFIRFIGYLIVTPSVLGLAFALLMFFSVGKANSNLAGRMAEPGFQTGVAIGSTLGVLGALMLAGGSLIGGLIGYLLLTKKKVFLCRVCGYILDRA